MATEYWGRYSVRKCQLIDNYHKSERKSNGFMVFASVFFQNPLRSVYLLFLCMCVCTLLVIFFIETEVWRLWLKFFHPRKNFSTTKISSFSQRYFGKSESSYQCNTFFCGGGRGLCHVNLPLRQVFPVYSHLQDCL